MITSFHEHDANAQAPYQTAIEQLMRACASGISDLGASLQSCTEALEAGATLAEIKGISTAQCDAIHEAIIELISQGRSPDAVRPALTLAMHAPQDPRFCFTAGLCLQTSGNPQLAMGMYAMSLQARPTATATLRLGECWVALGKDDEALSCFESAAELCGHDEEELAQRAAEAMDSVRLRASAA